MVFASIGLTMVGLVMLFSAGAVRGAQDLLFKQIVWVVISLAVGWYASIVNLDWLRKRSVIIYALCLVGLLMTLVPGIGIKVNGAQRWIGLGSLRVQPSEFAKIGLVLVLAKYFADEQREIGSFFKGFSLSFAIDWRYLFINHFTARLWYLFSMRCGWGNVDVSGGCRSEVVTSYRWSGSLSVFNLSLF